MQGPYYLASTSPYRAALLERLGLPFIVEAPDVTEAVRPGEAAAARALRLADAKAQAVAARHRAAWVLGADQVAECEGRLLDKPGDADRSRAQLQAFSGRAVRFHTAAVLARGLPAAAFRHVDCTTVRFRQLAGEDIARYVERDRPYDCTGSFRCEGLGIALCDAIESSDPTALIGLPMIWVARALRQAGLDPLAASLS